MVYDKLLNNYICLCIDINDFEFLLSNEYAENLYPLNERFASLFYTLELYDKKILRYIRLTDNGPVFYLETLKKTLCDYFNLEDDEDLLDNLVQLEKDIKEGRINNPNISKQMEEKYRNYRIKQYISPNMNNKKRKQIKKREFMCKVRRDIRIFRELLENEDKLSKIDNVFSYQKLAVYLAYKVMLHAKECVKKGDVKGYNEALKYLRCFLNNNPELIVQNYKLEMERNNKKIIYSIEEIKRFVSSQEKEEETSRNEDNYNFFECNGTSARRVLRRFLKDSNNSRNNELLQRNLRRKVDFYETINFVGLRVGLESFDGYIGFELENGYIILDKLFDSLIEGRIAEDNAIYIVKEEDFERVTKMSKKDAIASINKGKIEARRVIHSGSYEEKVVEYTKLN